MSPRILASVAAVTLASALLAPVSASADHRHSRYCGHRSYRQSYYDGGYYSRGYRSDPYYSGYSPRYVSRPYYYEARPYYYAKPLRFHYHGGARCYRSHSPRLSFHLRF